MAPHSGSFEIFRTRRNDSSEMRTLPELVKTTCSFEIAKMTLCHIIRLSFKNIIMPFKECFGLSDHIKPVHSVINMHSDPEHWLAKPVNSVNCDTTEIESNTKSILSQNDNIKLDHVWKVWYYHRHNRQEAVHWMANQKVIFELKTLEDVSQMVNGI